jgi:two-component system nitrate/nitrite response regulator NarL
MTILVEPRSLLREGLIRVLSKTTYRPFKSIASVDELPTDFMVAPQDLIFILSIEACRNFFGDFSASHVQELKHRYPGSRILILSEGSDTRLVIEALHAGADGCFLYTITPHALIKTLDLISLGGIVLTTEVTRAMFAQKYETPGQSLDVISLLATNGTTEIRSTHAPPKLSGKELEILNHLTTGSCNKDIARSTGMAEATVKTHIKAILRKINVSNRTQAALWAVQNMPARSDQAFATNHLSIEENIVKGRPHAS